MKVGYSKPKAVMFILLIKHAAHGLSVRLSDGQRDGRGAIQRKIHNLAMSGS